MNPTREEVAHTLQIMENSMQMPEYRHPKTGFPELAPEREPWAALLGVCAALGILALAIIGLCSLVVRK